MVLEPFGEPFLCLGLSHGHESPHRLSQEWMPHPKDRRLGDIPRFEQHAFHLHRKDLLPADIDDLRGASDKTDQPGLLLDKIAGIHPAIGIDRVRRVEIADHAGCRADVQHTFNNPRLEPFAADAQPERSGVGRLRMKHAELGQTVGLLQFGLRHDLTDAA